MRNEFLDLTYEETCHEVQKLVKQGLVVDSGRRVWSERFGLYEILWQLCPKGREQFMTPVPSLSSQRIANLKATQSNSNNH
jgi:hypothetical protein